MPAPSPLDRARVSELAADLRAAGFDAPTLRAAWGELADEALASGLRGPALRALERADATHGRSALRTLARLLALGVAQPEEAVTAALPRVGASGLVDLGLAERVGADVAPTAMIRPQQFGGAAGDESADAPDQGQWWIVSDRDEAALGGVLPTDHVLGVGGASLTLAGLQLPTPAQRGLDLGTGCGIQALRARRMVGEIVATDVSADALRYTELNAALNDVPAIEVRYGSLFAPVAGEQFDRIVSNPPFVITPRVAGVPTYEYRDGGMSGDDLVASVIREAGAHLRPGGVAQLLGNWEYRGGGDGLDRVREWVHSSPVPVEAWVIEREQLDPLAYAQLWIRDGGTAAGAAGHGELVEAWLEDFAARDVQAVGFGYVLLRRPRTGEPTLSRYERVLHPIAGPLGTHLAEALADHDRVTALDDAALATSVFTVAGDVTEARHHVPGAEDPSVIEIRQGGALARTIGVDPALAALVGACDGDLPVGTLIDAIAQLLDVDAAELRADLLPRVRELIFTGFLRFAA